MVEQEKAQAAPALPYLEDSSARLEKGFSNPWFSIDTPTLLIERPLCEANADVEDNYPYLLQDNLSKETFDPNEKNSITVNKLDEWSQPISEILPTTCDPYFEVNSPLSFWGTCPLDLDTMKMDDVFQVDKDDLVQSPTLAELNANDESLFDSFDCFDVFTPNRGKAFNKQLSMHDFNQDFSIAFNNADSPKNAISSSESSLSMNDKGLPQKVEVFKKPAKHHIPKEILIKPKAQVSMMHNNSKEIIMKNKSQISHQEKLQTVPASTDDSKKSKITLPMPTISDDSKKLKKNITLSVSNGDSKKVKKSLKPQLKMDCDNDCPILSKVLAEQSAKPLQNPPSLAHNNNSDTEDDSEIESHYSTDAEEDSEEEIKLFRIKHTSINRGNSEKKRQRYFWQYNMQSKGPKGFKMTLAGESSNALDVTGIKDPIFNADRPVDGIKHSGKARRGDGNDLTPNPKKLHNIGKELEKLNRQIDGLVPVSELPITARSKSRKEKNKLASRACRLKKKAQHEANKLKLFGLQEEQKHLKMLKKEVHKLIKAKVLHFNHTKHQSMVAAIESLQKKKTVSRVAGCSADFVNNVLQHVASGNESGGLSIAPVRER